MKKDVVNQVKLIMEKLMLKEFKNYLKLQVNSEKTVKDYVDRMIYFFKHHNEFNQKTINEFLTHIIDEHLSASTFNVTLATFKKYAKFVKIDVEFPKQRKVSKKLRATLNRDEIEKEILPYFGCIFKDGEKRKLVVRFMMLSLMRISEVTSLKKENVNFEKNQIQVINGKGAKNRITFLHKSIADDLKKEFASTEGEFAFNINNAYIRYIFTQVHTMMNYKKKISPHTLRHAGAKYLYNNNVSLKALKEILGHESLETTDRYLDFSTEEIQEQYDKVKYKKGI
ncbi:MAG: tyrosine-type recombinase/integrase [Candidatus Heimdallarchaeota archaeon]